MENLSRSCLSPLENPASLLVKDVPAAPEDTKRRQQRKYPFPPRRLKQKYPDHAIGDYLSHEENLDWKRVKPQHRISFTDEQESWMWEYAGPGRKERINWPKCAAEYFRAFKEKRLPDRLHLHFYYVERKRKTADRNTGAVDTGNKPLEVGVEPVWTNTSDVDVSPEAVFEQVECQYGLQGLNSKYNVEEISSGTHMSDFHSSSNQETSLDNDQIFNQLLESTLKHAIEHMPSSPFSGLKSGCSSESGELNWLRVDSGSIFHSATDLIDQPTNTDGNLSIKTPEAQIPLSPACGHGQDDYCFSTPVICSPPHPIIYTDCNPLAPKKPILHVYTQSAKHEFHNSDALPQHKIYFGRLSNSINPARSRRQELIELLDAIQFTPLHRDVMIYTCSGHAINCVTIWQIQWGINDWCEKDGNAVDDKDVIVQIMDIIDRRDEIGSRTIFEKVYQYQGMGLEEI